jgi:hypothetical protein
LVDSPARLSFCCRGAGSCSDHRAGIRDLIMGHLVRIAIGNIIARRSMLRTSRQITLGVVHDSKMQPLPDRSRGWLQRHGYGRYPLQASLPNS